MSRQLIDTVISNQRARVKDGAIVRALEDLVLHHDPSNSLQDRAAIATIAERYAVPQERVEKLIRSNTGLTS